MSMVEIGESLLRRPVEDILCAGGGKALAAATESRIIGNRLRKSVRRQEGQASGKAFLHTQRAPVVARKRGGLRFEHVGERDDDALLNGHWYQPPQLIARVSNVIPYAGVVREIGNYGKRTEGFGEIQHDLPVQACAF